MSQANQKRMMAETRSSAHIISYHIVVLKRHNRLKVGTDKPELKVKMQSVRLSDDDARKTF